MMNDRFNIKLNKSISLTLWVILIWTAMSMIFVLRSTYWGSFSQIDPNIVGIELNAWLFTLPFVPIISFIVQHDNSTSRRIYSILTLIGLSFFASYLYNYVFVQGVEMPLEIKKEIAEGQLNWNVDKQKNARFFKTEILDIFSRFMLISGITFVLSTMQRTREKEVNELKLKQLLTQAQANLLKSQLQPHFLFNTLNSISGLMDKNIDKAQKVLEDLSYLLRTSIKQMERNLIPLQEELNFIEKYLEIEQVRFGYKININWMIEKECRKAAIPHLIVQPLIENAIKHGFSKKQEDKKLRIEARKEKRDLFLLVEDNGIGLRNDFELGVGLKSIKERLSAIYKGKATIEFFPGNNQGLKVVIKIPFSFLQEPLKINHE